MNRIFKIAGGLVLGLFVLSLSGCSDAPQKNESGQSRLEKKIGSETLREISNASQVTVARPVKESGNQYVIGPKRHVLDGAKARELKSMLLNGEGYIYDKTKKCPFIPEIAFAFEGGNETVLMVNLFCNQIKLNTQEPVVVDYDPMAPAFNQYCREILDLLDKE